MDVDPVTQDERRALAADPATPPEVLGGLASDLALLPALLANPATPEATRQAILVDFPHLRERATSDEPAMREPSRPGSSPVGSSRPGPSPDAAFERIRQRQKNADQAYESRARVERYRDVAQGRSGPTNGLAVASFVVSLFGMSLLAVVFGHVALGQIARRGERGDGFAVAGLVIGYIGLVVGAWAVLTRL